MKEGRLFGFIVPQPRHELVKRVEVDWLHEVVVEAGRHRLSLVLIATRSL